MNKSQTSHEQVLNKTLTNCEKALHELHELLELVALLDLLELKTTSMGWVVGGWLRISLMIRLSQPRGTPLTNIFPVFA